MDATEDLRLARNGDAPAAQRLMPVVYDELRRIAAHYLRAERGSHTLQPTALVHEAYLKLVDQTRVAVRDREHFLAIAATAMRRILVDHARKKNTQKRDAAQANHPVGDTPDLAADFVAIDESLTRLGERDARQARIVELRYFAGLGVVEVAAVLGLSETTVKDDWRAACAFLRSEWERSDRTP